MSSKISRRDFLKGTAASALCLASTGFIGERLSPAAYADEAAPEVKTGCPAWTEMNPQDSSYDTYTTDFAELFSPIQVGHMTLRNRIAKSSAGSDTMTRGASELSQNAIDYYGRFADGGAAMIVLEEGTLGSFGYSITAVDKCDRDFAIAQGKRMSDRIHQGGAYGGMQLGIGNPLDPGDANAWTLDEIHAMTRQFADSALMMKDAGFDFVEIKGATTDGMNQFLTRRYNKREDEYGPQSEENRVRFFKEVIETTRAKVGDDFSIIVLINAMEENDNVLGDSDSYISVEEAQYVAKTLEAAGADLVQIRVATGGHEGNCFLPDNNHSAYMAHGNTGYGTQFDYAKHWAGLQDGAHDGVGGFIPLAAKIKEAVSVPVGCAGNVDPRLAPDLINNAIKDGKIDIVFMNRALTVDPELPNKLKEGRRDEVAPCMHCLHCHGRPYGEAEKCRVNVTTQFAYTDEMPEGYDMAPAETPKNVMVIGGGVAGMEAARVAAERGHSVTLYEKSGSLGGILYYAQAIKGNHERYTDLKAYMTRQLDLKGVKVITGTEVTVDTVKDANPDAVIVAVGGARETRFDGANVINMDTFAGAPIGDKVVILGGNMQATDMAQYLIAQGKTVTIINEGTEKTVDKEQSYWVRTFAKTHLYSHGVKVWNNASVTAVDAEGVTITLAPSGIVKTIPADTVLECWDMIPNTALLDEIKAAGYDTYAAGCDAPSNIQTSIHAGHMVARYL